MTRRVHHFDGQCTDVEYFAICGYVNRKFCLCSRSVYYGSTSCFTQIEMSAYKVSMKMSFEDIPDGSISFCSQFKVFINIPQRIYDGCFPVTFKIISRFAKTPGV